MKPEDTGDARKPAKGSIGLAGTYFVAAELSQQGYIATVTSRNAEAIDILASNKDGSRVVSIQVKTSGADQRASFSRSWWMNRKHEGIHSPSLFYVFVDLQPGNAKPDMYVAPSKAVADYVKNSHRNWLRTPGRHGRKHRDTDIRLFEINSTAKARKYHSNWESLGL